MPLRKILLKDRPQPPIPGPLYHLGATYIPPTHLADLVRVLGIYIRNRCDLAWNRGRRSRVLLLTDVEKETGIGRDRLKAVLYDHTESIRQEEFDKLLVVLGIHITDLIDERGPERSPRVRAKGKLEFRLERLSAKIGKLRTAVEARAGDLPAYRFTLRAGISSIVEEVDAIAVEQGILKKAIIPARVMRKRAPVPKYNLAEAEVDRYAAFREPEPEASEDGG